jgi:ribosomal protein S12 methylthiotransferase
MAYGVDLKYRTVFWGGMPVRARLLDLVDRLAGLDAWLRLHYVYPYPQVDALVERMAAGRLLPYLDVPFQHADPGMLAAMRRPGDPDRQLQRIERWRATCPGLTIRSTFIVGFPGETEAAFQGLLDFLAAARLDRVGCFTYSPVDGAAANTLPGSLPEEVKVERQTRLMELQAEISRALLAERVGRVATLLVDAIDGDIAIARGPGEAPEIDGVTEIAAAGHLAPGDFVTVRYTAAQTHDLQAEIAAAPHPGDG